MSSKQNLSILFTISSLMAFVATLPLDVPRYTKLGHNVLPSENSSDFNSSSISTTDRLGGFNSEPSSTTPPPLFEYALLGQDPQDQHWYRVSITPTNDRSGYRAQFATRKLPPFDAKLAHKHDKTINDLLNFLERSEEHNLLKVYGQLLASEEQEEAKIKHNAGSELEVENEEELKQIMKTLEKRPVLLVGELPGTGTGTGTGPTTGNQNATQFSMFKNFVYFIKGLK